MGVVSTIPEKCKRCYSCVRDCPAKAIKVENGQAMVIQERCIACGNCVKVCSLNAKEITDCTARILSLIGSPSKSIACLAPSAAAAFYPVTPEKVVTALKQLGFHEVWEVAFGAELVSREYIEIFKKAQHHPNPVITTACPAIVSYIEKHMPSLVPFLAPISSPMIAVGKAIRHRHGKDVHIIFIGPCIAKKNEFRDPLVGGVINGVLTFNELEQLFSGRNIDPKSLEESSFDGPQGNIARSFPISGGLLKSAGLSQDILENDVLVTEGKDRVLPLLKELSEGHIQAKFYDVLFCEGCINGPVMVNSLSVFARKQVLAEYIKKKNRNASDPDIRSNHEEFFSIDLSRQFSSHKLDLPSPSEEEISRVLQTMGKIKPEDQLNCGSCGYPSCREKAVAVFQGLAEPEMCLPYLIEQLQATCEQLKYSNEELASAQERLCHSERMASMGQLSAGVAHEINNPLGTVLIFSHMLLKNFAKDDATRTDLEMIVKEATRCKTIVRGLLDFARQSRVDKAPTDIASLLHEVVQIMALKVDQMPIQLSVEVAEDLPPATIDATQIKQLLVNLVSNGIDACGDRGQVKVSARLSKDGQSMEIRVTDDGSGISPENMSKLFSPFFTTKAPSKGTGLGLAIAYGVVKMHHGDIVADSELGKGTTFTISLPLKSPDGDHANEV